MRAYGRADLWEDYRLSVLWQTVMLVFQAGLNKASPVIWWNNFQRIMARWTIWAVANFWTNPCLGEAGSGGTGRRLSHLDTLRLDI